MDPPHHASKQQRQDDEQSRSIIDAGPSAERRESIDSAPLILREQAVAPWRGAAPQDIPGIPIIYKIITQSLYRHSYLAQRRHY